MPSPSRPDSFAVPASFAQRRLWLIDQLDPGTTAYNITWVLQLDGELDAALLRRSLLSVVERHEALRTTFSARRGQPMQVVGHAPELALPVIDVAASTPDEGEREQTAAAAVAELGRLPFDLARGPLVRARLIRLAPRRHLLALVLHHIVADAWSLELMLDELSQCYAQLESGNEVSLPELAIQYADFSEWQRQRWEEGGYAEDKAHWSRVLDGAPTLLRLPTDRQRPAAQSYRGACQPVTLDGELTAGVRTLANDAATTAFTVLLAAYACLLFRYSGASDLLIGVPVAGRTEPETERLVGLFVNTLAVRCQPSADLTFRAFLAGLRETTQEALAHQGLPFEQVLELVTPERNLGVNPVVQVLFSLNPRPPAVSRGAVRWTPTLGFNDTTKFDLHLAVEETAAGLEGQLFYATDLFEAGTIESMTAALQTLLRGVVANVDVPIADLPLLDDDRVAKALAPRHDTAAGSGDMVDVGAALAHWCRTRGEALAVAGSDSAYSYLELTEYASRLASLLRSRDVGPDTPVAVCLDRSAAHVAATLGVWLAGGTYLPLDPLFPAERLLFMLNDSGARLVITNRSARAHIGELAGADARVLCLDDDADAIAAQPAIMPTALTQPEHLAYIRYTSGSTGRPKGVAVRRHAVGVLLTYLAARFELRPHDRWLSVTTPSFDIATAEHLLPLIAGARLLVADQSEVADPAALRRRLVREHVSVLQATPATWRMLASVGGAPATVRLRLSAGEALSADVVDELRRDGASAWDGYGPTETTIYSTMSRVSEAPVPLGPPVGGTALYLLDRRGHLVPDGFIGEIYIGGAGLARGYRNRPDLTAERFVPDAISGTAGARLYRTGDLARRRCDARLDFLGRADLQVKIRGFRVELGEIETVLSQQDDVAAVAVAVTPGDDARLIAYVVPADAAGSDEVLWPRLRGQLRRRLPDFMIPAIMVRLDRLPTTPTGKLDRAALPEPDWSAARTTGYRPPGTETERALAVIWADLLAVGEIGVDDNFFTLGGHSLTAAELIARVHTQLGREMPLRALFERPTIAEFAELVDATPRHARAHEITPNGLLADLHQRTDAEIDELLSALIAEESA